ncbi:MAG TPA: DUF308 domain-containing protein [Pyrinomonadaceae bacterium]|nr:DUF308 domain-containing protein [Pyrinomonadaceae bacterium]
MSLRTSIKKLDWKKLASRRALGLLVLFLGAVALFSPIVFGGWVIALLGIALIAAGLIQFVETIRAAGRATTYVSYAAGAISILLGVVVFVSPTAVITAVLFTLTLFLLIDGGVKIVGAFKTTGQDRFWGLLNGAASLFLAALVWYLFSANLGIIAIGVAVGLRLVVEGWTMFFLPQRGYEAEDLEVDAFVHPDPGMELEPSEAVADAQAPVLTQVSLLNAQNIYYCLSLLAIFFVIHLLRTETRWSLIGFVSPFAALVGDAAISLVVAIVIVLPLRLLWRKLTRWIERAGWRRMERLREVEREPTIFEQAISFWLTSRLRFALELQQARYSLNFAFWRMLRVGLPVAAILIAINLAWGFSWYFNTENWASAVWQEITKGRVDAWRARMTADVESAAVANGVAPEKVFAIEPEGVPDDGDFSFVVIGDTGEGDMSQASLRSQIIAASNREDVKFLVVSSDIVYPDGKMKDYESKFYMPFMGFEKPIYAIPGNHDWFDANEGFNANFLDAESASVALRSRLAEDLGTKAVSTEQTFNEITTEAARLRELYGVRNGRQRGPYFEMHRPGFSLIAVDTGILRRVDERQAAWLDAALTRAGSNFKMVILGHPFFVAGEYVGGNDPAFQQIHDTLVRHKVGITLAGDTHDFEFYKEANGMLNFVDGGGGAYLSIGTALAFPDQPDVPDYAYYPPTEGLRKKVGAETPLWKMPFYYWLEWFGGYPFDSEMVSGAFDFNSAPFFQSFLEVRVERSHNRVRLLLYGVNGKLRWRDIQVGGNVRPEDAGDEDFVEFSAPMFDVR